MTEIWMDPVELRRVAGDIARQVLVLGDTVITLCSACACSAPGPVTSWLDAELVAITVEAERAYVGYLEQAVDLVQRATSIEADQAAAGVPVVTGQPASGLPTGPAGNAIGHWDWNWQPTPPVIRLAREAAAKRAVYGVSGGLGIQVPPFHAPSAADAAVGVYDATRTTLGPGDGITFHNGSPVDESGETGSISDVVRSPVTGQNEVET